MPLEEQVLELVENQLGRCIFVAFYLITHHFALFLHLLFWILAAEHDVAKHIDCLTEVLARGGCIVDCVFFVGKGIQLTTHALQCVDNLHRRTPPGTLESQMLTEVGQSLFAQCLMTSASLDGKSTKDNR